jgi:hypothetical protein
MGKNRCHSVSSGARDKRAMIKAPQITNQDYEKGPAKTGFFANLFIYKT